MKKLFLLLVLSSFYSFSQDNVQVQKPKLSVVELEKVKVVYRGIPNPIKISVPFFVKTFTVSGNGINETKDNSTTGQYIVNPGAGKEMVIKVTMFLHDETHIVEEHVFQIKGLPKPIGTINNEYATKGYLEFTKEELKDAIISTKMVDFAFNFNPPKTERFVIVSESEEIKIYGESINNKAMKFIQNLKKDSYIIIKDIYFPSVGIEMQAVSTKEIKIKLLD